MVSAVYTSIGKVKLVVIITDFVLCDAAQIGAEEEGRNSPCKNV